MFDQRLKKLREARGITQKMAAHELGIPHRTYASYENNEREPNSEILVRISQTYGVTVDYLIGIGELYSIIHNQHEAQLLKAYRANPAMQLAVDTLLGILDTAGQPHQKSCDRLLDENQQEGYKPCGYAVANTGARIKIDESHPPAELQMRKLHAENENEQ